MQWFFRKSMTNDQPYRKNLPTGPTFIRTGKHDVSEERQRLIAYIEAIEQLGPERLSEIPSLSLGKLSSEEWSNMLYKHLDHHLRQFGVWVFKLILYFVIIFKRMVLYYSLDFDLLLTPSFFIRLFDFLLVKIQYVLKYLFITKGWNP